MKEEAGNKEKKMKNYALICALDSEKLYFFYKFNAIFNR